MKKFKKEILAIIGGVVFAYGWQLFAILMASLFSDSKTKAMDFIPVPQIQLAIVPLVSWILMGLQKVRWFHKWMKITMCGLAFMIPFAIISVLVIMFFPSLCWKPVYWIASIAISVLLALTAFKPLIKFKYRGTTT